MRLPALWMVAAFSVGLLPGMALEAAPKIWVAAALVAILAGFACTWRNLLWPAWLLALTAWMFLGALALSLEHASIPTWHVTRLISAGKLDLSDPLRWRGRLRSDPVMLPWGFRAEIELEQVEAAGVPEHVAGGMRLAYFQREGDDSAPLAMHAGDRVEALVRLRQPRNFQNPGAFDARAHLARQGVDLTGSLRSLELLQKTESPPPTLAHRFARIRGHLLNRINVLFANAPEQAAVLRAMLLGDFNFVDHEVSDAFQKTSVYHVLVISGLHVAALAAFVWWVARRSRLRLGWTVLAVFAVLAFYVAIVEDRPPIERAALMAYVVLLGRLVFRRMQVLNTVAAAAILLLVLHPAALVDASFQLSFLAAAMIGGVAVPLADVTSGPFRRALEHVSDATRDAAHPPRAAQFRLDLRSIAGWMSTWMPGPLSGRSISLLAWPCLAGLRSWEIFLVSFTIQLGMLPLMSEFFHRVSLSGPLANMPAAVLSGLIVPWGFLALAFDAMWTPLGSVLAKATGALVAAMLWSVRWLSTWNWASFRVPSPPAWLLAVFYGLLACLALAIVARSRRMVLALVLSLGILALIAASYPFPPKLTRDVFEITMLDVGQGDSTFVCMPGGTTMLVDGGGSVAAGQIRGMRTGIDIGEQVVSMYLWGRGLKQLDVVVLTHAHNDHLEGLFAVLDNFRVGELWIGRDVSTPAFRGLLARARQRGVRIVHRHRGDVVEIGDVKAAVLWPDELAEADGPSNNDSLVLRFEHLGHAFLLPGDIQKEVEERLLAGGAPLAATFLKIAHNGSRTSTTPDFTARVHPQFAGISVGESNPFGHPHPAVVDRLLAAGAQTLRTDRDGAITVESDGAGVRVRRLTGNSSP